MYARLRVVRQIITILFIFIVTLTLFRIQLTKYLRCSPCLIPNTTSTIFPNISSNVEDEKTDVDDYSVLCLNMGNHLDIEKMYPESPVIYAPSLNSQKLYHFPYRYSQWRNSSILPRLLTTCEHSIFMNLLIIFDRICRQNEIIYFISEGTLLGSLRHHDIIPWDDDMDVLISNHQRKKLLNAFKHLNQTSVELNIVRGESKKENYYKLFYKNTPNAGDNEWRFPFLDIFLYSQDETYLWNLKKDELKIKINDVFPLVLRPLGSLWVPSPREPRKFFSFNPFNECRSHYWDHRNEIEKEEFTIKCNKLKDIYPFVEQNKKNNSIEILKINKTIIHTIIYK